MPTWRLANIAGYIGPHARHGIWPNDAELIRWRLRLAKRIWARPSPVVQRGQSYLPA